MPSVKKDVQEYRESVFSELAQEYLEGAELEDLAEKYNWGGKDPVKSLYYYFQKYNIELRPKETKNIKVAKEVSAEVTKNLSAQSQKIAQIALTIGGTIANRYLPMIDYEVGQGQTLEAIAMNLMDWYEMKTEINKRLARLEAENDELREDLVRAFEIAQPNYIMGKRQEVLLSYAKELVKYKAYGVKMPYKSMVKKFYESVNTLDASLEAFKQEGMLVSD